MFAHEQQIIEVAIRDHCRANGLPVPETIQWNPIPFSGEWGISTSFFSVAALDARQKQAQSGERVNVQQHAQEIAQGFAAGLALPEGFTHVEAVRGYVNLYFSSAGYSRRVVDQVLERGAGFGRGEPKGERVMVEFANINTHHSFHMGHYRNTILGEVLSRLVQFAGFETIRASYPGDIGLSVITVVWMYLKSYQGLEPENPIERGQWLANLYVEAVRLLEPKENETPEERAHREAYDAERREIYRKWDAGDPEIRAAWLKTREWSLEELRTILELLDIEIDVWFYESEVDEPAKQIVDELIRLGIADDERPEGPVIVKIDEKLGLKKEKYRTNVILRSDGTTLYLSKDLALAKVKFDEYHIDRSIYVVDVRQSMHLQQAFKILELWGYKQAEKAHHLGYGFVSLPEGAMSARHGRVVWFTDVVEEASRRVMAEIAQKNPDMPAGEREEVARAVGMGALAYALLAVDNNKDIVFDMDAALNFDGKTGPYIQNAYVRANSILRKAGGLPDNGDFSYPLTEHEVRLVEVISRFPATVQAAALEYRPILMATYAYELANTFHSFYHAVPVIQSEDAQVRAARLRLVAAARQTLANALMLLNIRAPEIM
jgi:arginyl-tRNA synthetase